MNPTAILAGQGARERILAMTPEQRLAAYEAGALSRTEAYAWAASCPEEVPLIDGELPWIVATLADLE